MSRKGFEVLVTGATGFVGRRLVSSLLNRAIKVRILKHGPFPIPEGRLNEVDIRAGDLTKPASLMGIAEGINSVFHLAGETRESRWFDSVNRIGTENLLKTCHNEGVNKFLFMSSVGVMGTAGRPGIVDELSPANPRTGYEKSKYEGERVALGYHDKNKMNIIVLRPSIVYGEGKDTGGDHFLSLVRSVSAGYFVLFGRRYISSYVYVGDVVAAAMMLMDHPNAGGETFIVNEPILLKDFFDEMYRNIHKESVPILPPLMGHFCAELLRLVDRFGSLYNATHFSMDKLKKFGFMLPFGYQEGLRRTISAYLSSLPLKPR